MPFFQRSHNKYAFDTKYWETEVPTPMADGSNELRFSDAPRDVIRWAINPRAPGGVMIKRSFLRREEQPVLGFLAQKRASQSIGDHLSTSQISFIACRRMTR